MVSRPGDDGVERIATCTLQVGQGSWPFAAEHHAEIDAHWLKRKAASPTMFNGVIYILEQGTTRTGHYRGTLMRTDFKSFLYWKDLGYPDHSVRDVFGSALLVSAEGHVVLGRQAAGHLNAGLAYLPGGFIDQRDVGEDGRVDLEASIARELAEETGLLSSHLEREPGFLKTRAGPMTSLAVCYRAPVPAEELVTQIERFIARDTDPELSGAVVIRTRADVESCPMPIYARVLLAHLFAAR